MDIWHFTFIFSLQLLALTFAADDPEPVDDPESKPVQGHPHPPPSPDYVCSMRPEPGPCEGYFPRYYYDPGRGSCRRFIYGGCRGNGNNFYSRRACERYCESQSYPTCATKLCGLCEYCVMEQMWCIRPPCPPMPVCKKHSYCSPDPCASFVCPYWQFCVVLGGHPTCIGGFDAKAPKVKEGEES